MRRKTRWKHALAAGFVLAALPVLAGIGSRPPMQALSEPGQPGEVSTPTVEPTHSVARIWNDHLLNAIRRDVPKPPPHARNLFHVSVGMWDAWAAYDPLAEGFLVHEKLVAPGCVSVPGSTDDEDEDGDDGDSEEGGSSDDDSDDEHPDVAPFDCAAAERAEAISFAAYRILKYRFPVTTVCPHPGSAEMQAAFDAQMDALGYDRTFTSTVGDTPAALGNRIAAAVLAHGLTDGANESPALCYPDNTNYFPQNPELIFKLPGNPNVLEPNNWQPLAFDHLILQNGIVIGAAVQQFVGTGWGDVKPFALTPSDIPANLPHPCYTNFSIPQPFFDPGCPAQLGGVGDATLKQAMLELIRFSGRTDPTDGVLMDASPGAIGNNSLGVDDGAGHPVNPATGQPYAPNIVKRADWQRIVAQFWSDGPQSETPPGHWNVVANEVADHPETRKKIGGVGPTVTDLEWDVKVYLALNGAVHDAAIGSWSTKHYYDSSRPITLIRHMAGLGQSSDASQGSYHPDGLLLEPGLVEVVTAESIAPGERHHHLKSFCGGTGAQNTNVGQPCNSDLDCPDEGPFDGFCESSVGKIAVYVWKGPPADPEVQTAGAGWRLASMWMPWFPKTFVTPPFPGYTSGHSTFSRSAAEVMTAITGSEFVPGGLGHFDADTEYLEVEQGPSAFVQLQWATYYDAADQAGISRRFGGIHPFFDDFPARVMGSTIGQKAWLKAVDLYNVPLGGGGAGAKQIGDATPVPGSGSMSELNAGAQGTTTGTTAAETPAPEAGQPAEVTEPQPRQDRQRRILRRGDGRR